MECLVLDNVVLTRTKKRIGWTDDFAELVLREYRRFLDICRSNPNDRISPSPVVDELWHDHILHTADYKDFCDKHIGRFIHHAPVGLDKRCDDIMTYVQFSFVYEHRFGETPSEFVWPLNYTDNPCSATDKCRN